MKIIAIDGVASSGKGTLAKELAKRLNYVHLDTGALYRCATVQILNEGINPEDEEKIVNSVLNAKIEARMVDGSVHYFLNNKDLSLSNSLRTPEVNNTVAKIAKYPRLREQIRKIQKDVASTNNCVVEGRDITTVVFPNADYKFFITADAKTRAKRRQNDYKNQGIKVPLKEVEQMIIERDLADEEREASPLVCPPDAHIIDNGENTVEQSINQMLSIINKGVMSDKAH